MARRRRPFTPSEIDRWKATVRSTMETAQSQMRSHVARQLRAQGLTWDSPSVSAAQVWSQPDWSTIVHRVVGPVARDLAKEMFTTLRGRVTIRGAWGGPDDQSRLAGLLVSQVVDGGRRVSDAIGPSGLTAASVPRIVHPDARPTVAHAYQAAYDQLNKLASNVASHMSNAAITVLSDTAARYDPLVQNVWLCSFVPASRDDHIDANEQVQYAGDPFDIGDEQLMYPGDPEGSDEQTANCLCWLEMENVELDVPDEVTSDDQETVDIA